MAIWDELSNSVPCLHSWQIQILNTKKSQAFLTSEKNLKDYYKKELRSPMSVFISKFYNLSKERRSQNNNLYEAEVERMALYSKILKLEKKSCYYVLCKIMYLIKK